MTATIWIADEVWRLLRKYVIVVRYENQKPSRFRWIVEYARVFFPVLLIVFMLRSFVVEPFRIPSGSMLPTLEIGDFILVNKYEYGLRLPVINRKVIEMDSPDYGDVIVFRFPQDPAVNFIKRVVGLPGDSVVLENKEIKINGEQVAQVENGEYVIDAGANRKTQTVLLTESFGFDEFHQILHDERRSSRPLVFQVPENSYFVLGDNRDYSNDSRFWGFVPEENVVGRAFFIWFSWNFSDSAVNWSRIAAAID